MVKARWEFDKKWYDAKIVERKWSKSDAGGAAADALATPKYKIEWIPPQPDDLEKKPADLRRNFRPPKKAGCIVS